MQFFDKMKQDVRILFDKMKRQSAAERILEEHLYEVVVKELQGGIRRDGLWAKAWENSQGQEAKAESLYISYRVQSLKDEMELTAYQQAEEKAAQADGKQDSQDARQQSVKDEREKRPHEGRSRPNMDEKGGTPWWVFMGAGLAILLLVLVLRQQKMESPAALRPSAPPQAQTDIYSPPPDTSPRPSVEKSPSTGSPPARSPRPSVAKSPSTGSPPAVLPSKRSTLSQVFTVGSTFATVRRFRGKPSKTEWIRGNTTKWHYGKEWVEFDNGTVKGWSSGFRFLRRTKSESGGTP